MKNLCLKLLTTCTLDGLSSQRTDPGTCISGFGRSGGREIM